MGALWVQSILQMLCGLQAYSPAAQLLGLGDRCSRAISLTIAFISDQVFEVLLASLEPPIYFVRFQGHS